MPVSPTIWAATKYDPFEEQINFHTSMARFKVPACGRRFGKSRMAAAEVEPYVFNVNMRGIGWIVAPSYDTADEFQYLWDDIVVKMGWGRKIKKANNPRTGEMYIEMPWGHKVVVKSAAHMDTLTGKGLRWCILSEAAKLPEIIFDKYIRPALADYRAPCIMPSTPEGFNWFKEKYDMGQNPDEAEWESWNFPAWKNPHVYPGGFEDSEIQSQNPNGENDYFWQELGADFRSLVGLVYREFDRERHVLKEHWKYDPRLPNFNAFDFGYTNPFVCLDIQVTPSDKIIIWREYYHKKRSVVNHAKELAVRKQPEGFSIECGYGDAGDPEAVEQISEYYTPTIAEDDAKERTKGIMEVRDFLESDRILIDPSCVNTIKEFENHRMKRSSDRAQAEDPKDEPMKKHDHALDAIRYFIMHYFVLGVGKHLEDLFDEEDLRGEESEEGVDSFFSRSESDGFSMGATI
jgi:hypothetical protein